MNKLETVIKYLDTMFEGSGGKCPGRDCYGCPYIDEPNCAEKARADYEEVRTAIMLTLESTKGVLK